MDYLIFYAILFFSLVGLGVTLVGIVLTERDRKQIEERSVSFGPGYCVQEAELVLFRYQYRLAHGQVDASVDEA